jgi:cbb3-type cytochrome oxidase maturation protein
MEALFLLVPLSVVIVFIAIWAFFRASDTGQFDDMVGPALRILQDDDRAADGSSLDEAGTKNRKEH